MNDDRATLTTDFVCECGDPDCTQTVLLRDGDYELVRSDPLLFTVVPGHEIPDVEDVVAENQRFHVVREHVAEELLAREAEPRLY